MENTNIDARDRATLDLFEFLRSHPGEDPASPYDAVAMMYLVRTYILAGRQVEEEDLEEEYFSAGTEAVAEFYASKCDSPDFLEVLREYARRFLDTFQDGPPDEEWQSMVTAMIDIHTPARVTPALPEAARTLLFDPYIHLLNGELTNALFNLDMTAFDEDPYTGTATLERDGIAVEIEGYTEFIGDGSSSPLKLFDAITAYLTFNNPYRAKKGIQCVVEIPEVEYAAVRGIDLSPPDTEDPEEYEKENRKRIRRENAFKKDIERDLDNLARFRFTARMKKGRNAGDYDKIALVTPDHSIKSGIIQVTVPQKTAEYLLNSYVMTYAPKIQSLPDTNPSLYPIARKMLLHSSMDRNYNAGTNTTLKVSTLVSSTPHIPDLEVLKKRGQRNWKDKIKKPLEKVLLRLEESGFLVEWEYTDPRTKDILSPEETAKLTDNGYMNTNIEYRLMDNPLQNDRQKRIAEERKQKEEQNAENP